jgi:hypothetical protein
MRRLSINPEPITEIRSLIAGRGLGGVQVLNVDARVVVLHQ